MIEQQLHLFSNKSGKPVNNNWLTKPSITVQEVLSNGFIILDKHWNVIEWNNAAEKLLRVEAKNIIGNNFWDRFAGLLPVEFYANYYKAFQSDFPVQFEEYWAEMGAWFRGVVYPQKQTISISFTCSNQPTNPEQKAKVLRDLYLFVTEVTNDCLWEWDLQAKQLFWIDGGHKRMFGYPIENTIIPQSYWESRIHPDDYAGIHSRLQTLLSAGTNDKWEDEYRLCKMDGSYATVHDCGHIFYNEDKVAIRMIGATKDITDRKKAEQQLLASEQKLALIAKQTVHAVIITDADQHITWVNEAFTTLTGYQAGEVAGKIPGHFLEGNETDPQVIATLTEKIEARQPFDCKLIYYSKAGEKIWVHLGGQALFDEQGICNQFFSILTNITEQMELEIKLMEERLARQREITGAVISAQETERAEIGKELHDNLNQLLAVAKLYIQMATKSESKRVQYLNRSCELITNVIDEVRRISKALIVPGMHEIGVLENIQNLIDDLKEIHPVVFTLRSNKNLSVILDKQTQLTIFRLVQEQVGNILKHANASKASIHLSIHSHEVHLRISDNGNGHNLQHPVNGVGIMNMKSRVHVNHGTIHISSAPGKGYTLEVSLPFEYSLAASTAVD